MEEELPFASDIAKADDIELQEIMEKVTKSMEDLITQFEGQQTLPMCEILGLDKQLRSIRGSLKGSVGRKHQERKAQARGIMKLSWSLPQWQSRRHHEANCQAE